MSEPLFSLAGRGLNVDLKLNYDSHLYEVDGTPNGPRVSAVRGDADGGWYTDAIKGSPAYGFTLGFGVLIRYGTFMGCQVNYVPPTQNCIGTSPPPPPQAPGPRPVFIDSTGARHGANFASSGSNQTDLRFGMEGTTPTVTYPDGTKLIFGVHIDLAGGLYSSQEWYCVDNGIGRRTCTLTHSVYYPTRIIDRNGNYITINYLISSPYPNAWGGPHISTVVDTLGREIKFHYDSDGWRLLSITAPGFQPNTEREIVRFSYEGLQRKHYFDQQPAVNENVTVLRALYFPATHTGVRYSYSTYGMIYKIERFQGMDLASDGTVSGTLVASTEYDYPITPQNLLAQIPKYTKRTDWWLGSTVGSTEHQFASSRPDSLTSLSWITTPEGSVTEIKRKSYLSQNVGPAEDIWDDRLVQQVRLVKDSREFSKEKFQWLKTPTGPRLSQSIVIVDGGPEKKTTYQYTDLGCSSNCVVHNSPTVIREYGFDGAEIRRTEIEYLNNSQYLNRYLLDLPTTTKTYDSVTNQLRSRVDYQYDTNPSLTSYSNIPNYEDPLTTIRGNLTVTSSNSNAAAPGDGVTISVTNQYDTTGNVVSVTDPKGNVSQTAYSADYGRAFPTLATSAIPDSNPGDGINGLTVPLTTETTYNFNTGLVTSKRSENDQVTTMEYDPALRPILIAEQNGGGQLITEYGDEPGNRFVKNKKQFNANVWEERRLYFDGRDRTIKSEGNDGRGQIFTETMYDVMGREWKTSNAYRPNDEKQWVTTIYDPLGRVEQVISPQIAGEAVPARVVTEYSSTALGQVQTSTTEEGSQTRRISNAFGQLIRVDEPHPLNGLGSIENPLQTTNYKYDLLGHLIKVTQGAQSRYFSYDSAGRLVRAWNPEQELNPALEMADLESGNSHWSSAFEYDQNGNVLKMTDAKGVERHCKYDNLNRLIERNYVVPQTIDPKIITVATPTAVFKYDGVLSATAGDPNPAPVPLAKAMLTEVSNSISMTQFNGFDNQGRVRASRQITNGSVYAFAYEHNAAGALVKEVYPSGREVTYGFDAQGDRSSVGSNLPGQVSRVYASDFRYTANGTVDQVRLGNGRWETIKLNNREQVAEIGLGASASDTSLWKVTYEYGRFNQDGTVNASRNDGSLLRQTITAPGAPPFVQAYDYDSTNRLTEAKETISGVQNWKQSFSYDQYGNRIGFSYLVGQDPVPLNNINNPAVASTTNRLQAGQGYEYDLNGNLIQVAEGKTFSFDADNLEREAKSSSGAVIATYSYDGQGKRVKKVVANQETTIFVYDISGKLVAEYSDSQQHQGTTYITSDTLNSPRVLTNSAGEVTSRRDFMPFGELISARSAGQMYGLQDGLRKGFTGYEKDDETQHSFAEARYYNAAHGRFLSVDPLMASAEPSKPQTWNRYAYVVDNPFRYSDPTGEDLALTGKTKEKRDEDFEHMRKMLGEERLKYVDWEEKEIKNLGTVILLDFGSEENRRKFEKVGGNDPSEVEFSLGMAEMIGSNEITEYQVAEEFEYYTNVLCVDHVRLWSNVNKDWGGGATLNKAESLTGNVQIFVSKDAAWRAFNVVESNRQNGKKMSSDGQMLLFTAEQVDAHEFGHAYNAIKYKMKVEDPWRALRWENIMRLRQKSSNFRELH